MSTHNSHHECLLCGHSKANVTKQILAKEVELNDMNEKLKDAKNETDFKKVETEVVILEDQIKELTVKKRKKVALINKASLKQAKKKRARFEINLQTQIDRSTKVGSPADTLKMKEDMKKTLSNLDNNIQFLQSKEGSSSLCTTCVKQIATNMDILSEAKQLPAVIPDVPSLTVDKIPTPEELRKFLNIYVIGQNMAKTYIAGTVALHYRRAADMLAGNREKFSKANILLIGPTGVGKTEILRTLRRCLSKKLGQIPMTSKSATKITEAGYVGDDAEIVIEALFHKALKAVNPKNEKVSPTLIEKAVQLTQLGIVHIDEIDKIADDGSGAGGSVSRKGAQNALLTMMEGDNVTVKIPTGVPGQSIPVDIDTSTILFIGSGAFMGKKGSKSIYELSELRRSGSNNSSTGAGFLAQFDDAENYAKGTVDDIEPEDVVNYGLGHEFVGRLTNIATLSRLSIHALARIITEPKGAALPEYIEDMMKFYNINIMLSQDALIVGEGEDDANAKTQNLALKAIATKADERKTGARAIQSVINRVTFFITNFPEKLTGKHILITEEAVNDPDKLQVFDDPNGEDFEYIGDLLAPTLAKIGEKDDIDNGIKPAEPKKEESNPEPEDISGPEDDKS